MSVSAKFKPLLSAKVETEAEYDKLEYPMLASPKLDGIRCALHPTLGPVSRTLKPIPNKFIRETLIHPKLRFLDGEVVVGNPTAPDVFNQSQSGVMSAGGNPDFTYYAFDHFGMGDLRCPFTLRLADAEAAVREYAEMGQGVTRVEYLRHYVIENREQLDAYEQDMIEQGYEGIMLRKPGGHYKFNRSTFKEQILIKVKRFEDAEARIIGYEPLLRNQNEAFKDERGYQKRSYSQEGKVADDTRIGKFLCVGVGGRWHGIHFSCGSGLDDNQRLAYRKDIDNIIARGQIFTYKFQPHGSLDRPRAPIFKGFRSELDF